MTKENLKRLYKHFSKLASGNFTEADLSTHSTSKGKMSVERKELIKSNGIKCKKDIERKHPQVVEELLKEEKENNKETKEEKPISKKKTTKKKTTKKKTTKKEDK